MNKIPDNNVEIEIIIKDNGEYEAKIVGHGKNTSCFDGNDEKLLEDLLSGIGDATDFGHTQEYYEEKSNRMTKNNGNKQKENKKEEKQLDNGYGV